uniref:Uncharacterized protein n=1 Tax=Oryza meridionalis TaxID=40149 RepID=A0A0E0DAB1_9ORYZ
MLTGERRCGGRIEGGRRAPPLLAGWGSAQAAGEETKFEAEAEAGWDGLGCECGGSRRTPAPPLLAGCQRQARRRESRAAGEETGRIGEAEVVSQPAIFFHLTPLYSHLNPNLRAFANGWGEGCRSAGKRSTAEAAS